MIKIKDLQVGKKVDVFGLIEVLQEKQTSNNKTYIEMVITDNTGKVNVKSWDTTLENIGNIKVGNIVKVRGNVDEWEGNKQIIVIKNNNGIPLIRLAVEQDNIDMKEFIEIAPIEPKIMLKELKNIAKAFKNEDYKSICLRFLKEYEEELLYFPGTQTIHHAVKGGLLYHIYSMVKIAIPIADYYSLNKELLLTGIIIHDIGKIEQLNADENGKVDDYTKGGYMLGHMIQGIKMLNRLVVELDIDKEILLLLEHMIASHHFHEEWGAYQKPMFVEAEVLHHLDMIDSRVDLLKRATEKVDDGQMSSKNPYLKRMFYKPKVL